eukprot:TRINITY_DN98250_c0_g1_i1.p1 TRINITY_DN98250_c0_g1~~TRINITY_DN98250_c0_g1_i1.p1  ORF type:complete len:237 (-),score=56.75 TRINITY_DN98250_c0_g1_i1:106-816(-)
MIWRFGLLAVFATLVLFAEGKKDKKAAKKPVRSEEDESFQQELQLEVYDAPSKCKKKKRVKEGDYVKVHYIGTIDKSSAEGKPGYMFGTSRNTGDTLNFMVGELHVVEAWDRGLLGHCEGTRLTMVVPPEYGYGDKPSTHDPEGLPGGSTLHYDLEIVEVSQNDLFTDLDTDKDGMISQAEMLVFYKKQGLFALPHGLLEDWDKDGDGMFSWEEFGASKPKKKPEVKYAKKSKDDL